MGCCTSDLQRNLSELPCQLEQDTTIKQQANSKDFCFSPQNFVFQKVDTLTDNYCLGAVLGQGGFGCVRLATHLSTGVRKAVKTIRKASLIKPDLYVEFEMLKDLDHPHILRVSELYVDERNYHMVTELCEGSDLFDKIQQSQQFSEKTAAVYINQILSAVYYCHKRNIIHKDLKPENIMFLDNKDLQSLKIIDFGLAQLDNKDIEYNSAGSDGSLSRDEIQNVSKQFSLCIPVDVDAVIEQCDADGNGAIEYSEFITAAINWQQNLSIEKLEAAFRAFDIDGNGSIDLGEIKMILGTCKGGQNDQKWIEIMKEADLDGDSVISLDEFKKLILKV